MSISTVPSSTKRTSYARRKKAVTHKRLQNQNAEISELASLVPVSMLPPPSVEGNQSEAVGPLVPSNSYSSSAMDKLSVLRLASSYLKLQQFMKDTTHVNGSYESTKHPFGVIEEAIDGFLLVLDKEGDILYVSETIIDCVGLRQQDVIGQSLVDITHPSSAVEIVDSLKPSVTFPSSVAQPERVFSQLRQFYVRFKSTVYNSRITSHTMVQVNGNLKVKLPPLKTPPSCHSGQLEFVEPSVVGFIGECHRINSGCSAMDVVLPLTSFSWTKTLDRKLISCDATVKDIIGYSADELIASNGTIELLHPAYSNIREPMKNYFLRNGHMVSPLVRVLTSSGDWIWMTTEVTLRCKSGTAIPQFVDFKARVFSQGIGKVKYALDRKTHISISTRSPALAVADGDSIHRSTTSKKSKETMTKSSAEEVLKGIKLPDAIFKAVLLSRVRERATLAANVDNTAACCESTTESNSSCSNISSKVSQLDPEHQLPPPQPQVDQPTCTAASAITQGKNEGGATCSSDPPPVSSIAAYGDSDTSRASSLSDSHKVVCSSTAQPGHGACTLPPVCISHDHTPAQSPGTVGYCADITSSHADKDSSCSPVDSHSTDEQAVLSPVEDPTRSAGGTGSSPNNKDFQVQTNTNSQSTDSGLFTGATHSPINSSSTSVCGGVNLSSCANLQAADTSLHAVAALDLLQQDHQTSNILSQGFNDLDFNFGCTIPCDAAPTASNPEYAPNYLMPGAQSLTFNDLSDHSDPIMQQVLGDTDIMDGDLNLGLYANGAIISDYDWSKSMESATPYYSLSPKCHTNFTTYSVNIPESGDRCSWYQPKTSHSDSISDFNEANHEVHDILQQFM